MSFVRYPYVSGMYRYIPVCERLREKNPENEVGTVVWCVTRMLQYPRATRSARLTFKS